LASRHKIINFFLRKAWTGRFAVKQCSHVGMIGDVRPGSDVCERCVALGDTWPALRMCLECSHVGCCDSGRHQHALEHFEETGHPLIRPYGERGMSWIWCYEDRALLDARGGAPDA
jgi:uncharacterized UBP type Zn finger protein